MGMNTTLDLSKNLHMYASVKMGELQVRCKIENVRVVYGRLDYKVTPVHGSGEVWVSDNKVTNIRDKP
jgi:hypothetical protein